MYEKLIDQLSAPKHQQPFNIRLSPIPFDEKAGYIDSVCAVLIESRFGPGSKWQRLDRMSPDREPSIFCDLTVKGPGVTFNLTGKTVLGRAAYFLNLSVKPLLTRGPPHWRVRYLIIPLPSSAV